MRRDKILKIRLNFEEQKELREKFKNKNISGLVRDFLLNMDTQQKKNEREDKKSLAIQIARIGNNINQITRAINQSGGLIDHKKMIVLHKQLIEIKQELINL